MSDSKPHSELVERVRDYMDGTKTDREEGLLWLARLEEQYEGVLRQLTDGRESEAELRAEWVSMKEQNGTLLRVVNAAIAYCSDVNNRGEADTDDLEAAIAALYPATEITQAEIDEGAPQPPPPYPASRPSMYEGTPLPHGIACRCSVCSPARRREALDHQDDYPLPDDGEYPASSPRECPCPNCPSPSDCEGASVPASMPSVVASEAVDGGPSGEPGTEGIEKDLGLDKPWRAP